MSTPTVSPPAPSGSITSTGSITPDRAVSPAGADVRRRARQARGVALWLLVLVVAATVLAWFSRGEADTYLDPHGTGQRGIGALVAVLAEQGVAVETATTLEQLEQAKGRLPETESVTVALGASTYLGSDGATRLLKDLRPRDELVVLDPSAPILDALDVGYLVAPIGGDGALTPECAEPITHDRAVVGRSDARFTAGDRALSTSVITCYPLFTGDAARGATDSLLLSVPASTASPTRPHAIAISFGVALTNRYITDHDHAALGLRLLGAHPHLIIYTPSITDAVGASGTPAATVEPPEWLLPGLVLIALAIVAYAVAVGRRHGRLVPEPLPVVVKASEATHSRAELYRAARDRGRAAQTLRAGTLARLRRPLTLGPVSTAQDAVRALVGHGIPTSESEPVLCGPEPTDDAGLVRLAHDLISLEQKVNRR